jgi:hypothetical protein
MSARKSEPSFDQFYSAIGRATTSWFILEEGLRDVFSRLIICSVSGTMLNVNPVAYRVMGCVFYGSTNLRARLDVITDILRMTTSDESLLNEWTTVKNQVVKLYKRRNIFAWSGVRQ